jgi:transcriptional regulator with XRE-family HTH domain
MVTAEARENEPELKSGPWTPEWTLADRLRRIRRSLDMGQREFAERLQQKLGTYQQWEADISRPRDQVALARRVELLTGVPASWTLGIDGPAPRPSTPAGDVERARRDSNPQPSDP